MVFPHQRLPDYTATFGLLKGQPYTRGTTEHTLLSFES